MSDSRLDCVLTIKTRLLGLCWSSGATIHMLLTEQIPDYILKPKTLDWSADVEQMFRQYSHDHDTCRGPWTDGVLLRFATDY